MDPNKLTQSTQAALQEAQATALRHGHTEVDVAEPLRDRCSFLAH